MDWIASRMMLRTDRQTTKPSPSDNNRNKPPVVTTHLTRRGAQSAGFGFGLRDIPAAVLPGTRSRAESHVEKEVRNDAQDPVDLSWYIQGYGAGSVHNIGPGYRGVRMPLVVEQSFSMDFSVF